MTERGQVQAWATVKDAAAIIGRTRKTIYGWIRDDRLECIGGQVYMPDVEELYAVMSRRRGKGRLKNKGDKGNSDDV
ncbi:DNA-binding protein [Mycetocola tolaasinivorans]|uniref:DNA-binding protein n=1 Tax=Mycetocola tolaasinivorans TaxID=76635 RepID=A0A3L7A368_9MICO|nr:DNA-binding protein [Mycetocola tolaasinivorans]